MEEFCRLRCHLSMRIKQKGKRKKEQIPASRVLPTTRFLYNALLSTRSRRSHWCLKNSECWNGRTVLVSSHVLSFSFPVQKSKNVFIFQFQFCIYPNSHNGLFSMNISRMICIKHQVKSILLLQNLKNSYGRNHFKFTLKGLLIKKNYG